MTNDLAPWQINIIGQLEAANGLQHATDVDMHTRRETIENFLFSEGEPRVSHKLTNRLTTVITITLEIETDLADGAPPGWYDGPTDQPLYNLQLGGPF